MYRNRYRVLGCHTERRKYAWYQLQGDEVIKTNKDPESYFTVILSHTVDTETGTSH